MVTKNQRAAQLQVFQLAGAGVSQGDSTMTLVSFNSIAGIALTMAAFGTSGYITVEPGSGQYEEQINFTGITNNMDGTVTLTGISNVSMLVDPVTEEVVLTPNFAQDHAGGVNCCVSNTSGWYGTFANINNTMTIHEPWTFNAFAEGANPQIDSNSYVFQPLDYITTGGVSSLIVNGTFNYWQDTGSVNSIVITPSPAVTAYAAGQFFFINVADTNTGATTINVNGLGAIDLKKEVSVALNPGDILAGEIILVSYDGTNFQLIGGAGGGAGGGIVTRSAIGAYTLASGATTLIDTEGIAGATAGNLMTGTGTITNLYINQITNTLNGSTVYTLLKNGSPTSITVTVTSGATGVSFDAAHAFSVVGGDLITLQCDTTGSGSGAGTVSFSYQVGTNGSSTINVTNVTEFDDFTSGFETTVGSNVNSILGNFFAAPNSVSSITSETDHPGIVNITTSGNHVLGFGFDGSSSNALSWSNDFNITMLVRMVYTVANSGDQAYGIYELSGGTNSLKITVGAAHSGNVVYYDIGAGNVSTGVSFPASNDWFVLNFTNISGTLTATLNNNVIYSGNPSFTGLFNEYIGVTTFNGGTITNSVDYVITNYEVTR